MDVVGESSDFDFFEDRAENQNPKLVDGDLVGIGDIWQNDDNSTGDISGRAIIIIDCAGVSGLAVYDDDPIAGGSAGKSWVGNERRTEQNRDEQHRKEVKPLVFE